MSTTRDHNDYVFQCDAPACREMLETSTSNFEAARNLLRRAGWKPIRRSGDDWQHLCARCVKAGVRLAP
jgi:hypothetical protein